MKEIVFSRAEQLTEDLADIIGKMYQSEVLIDEARIQKIVDVPYTLLVAIRETRERLESLLSELLRLLPKLRSREMGDKR